MALKKSKKNREAFPVLLFPFSADPEINKEKNKGWGVYEQYLDAAFQNPRIHNIVVSGDYGIGKSSILRTYENSVKKRIIRTNKRKYKKGFLFLSLGYYKNALLKPDNKTKNNRGAGQKEKSTTKYKNQQIIFERRILLQIYAAFHKKDLPASSFKMVQEHVRWRCLIAVWCTIIALLVFVSINTDSFVNLIIDCQPEYNAVMHKEEMLERQSNTNGQIDESEIEKDMVRFQNEVDERKAVYKNCIFICNLLVIIITVWCFAYFLLPSIKAKQITIKANSFEATCEREACDSYIDQHATEIVYCLEKIARKINYTVIIEDLDRVDPTIFYEIFARLREINNLVNLRLAHNGSKKWMRFVYVVNDSAVSQLDHSKFADVIIPVFPELNENTSEIILTNSITKMQKVLQKNGIKAVKEEQSATNNQPTE